MTRKIILSVLLLCAGFLDGLAVQFPLADSTKIDKTYGDFNPSEQMANSKYHDGIDFLVVGTTTVLSPVSGAVVAAIDDLSNEYKSYIVIQSSGDPYYWFTAHVIPYSQISSGTTVQAGEPIGTVYACDYSHVHVGRSTYPYRYQGDQEDPLQYYPSTQTVKLAPDNIFFVPAFIPTYTPADLVSGFPNAATGEKIVHNDTELAIFGRTDVNGGNQSGFYRLDYEIDNSTGGTPVPLRTTFAMVRKDGSG